MGRQNYTSFNIYQRMGKAPGGVGKFNPSLEKAAEQGKLPANFASKVMANKENPTAPGKNKKSLQKISKELKGAVKMHGKQAASIDKHIDALPKALTPTAVGKSIYAKNHNMFSRGVESARAGLEGGFKTAEQAGKKRPVPPPEDTNDENENKENKGKDLTDNIDLSGGDKSK